MQKRFGIRCCVHRRGIRLLVGWINAWLNELTGKKVSCWKETMEINKVFGLILLLIIDCFIFQCVWACMFKLSKLVLRASPHWVSSYDTLPLPIYSTNSLLFQILISSLPTPGGLPTLAHAPHTPTCWAVRLYLLPHSSVSFCTIVYSHIYIVPITRAWLCPAHPLNHKPF